MKTELAREYRSTYSVSAMSQIQTWAAAAAEACHGYGDQQEDANVAAAFHADGSKFARLDKAIRDVMDGTQGRNGQ